MPQEVSFPPTLRVREVVDFVRAHYPEPAPTQALLHDFGLEAVAERQAGGLSGGTRRRLALALAFAGRPPLVFLDEPTTGLDVAARREVWELLRAFAHEGGTALLTTHYLEEAEALASRVAILDHGRVLVSGTVAEVKARVGLSRIQLRAASVPQLPGVVATVRGDGRVTLVARDVDEAVRALVTSGVAFAELEVVPLTLEEAFLHLTAEPR
jgi:ABC-2 type transport system ATP-binding protein